MLWDVWKLQYAHLVKSEEFISFENYKLNLKTKKHTEISYEEIEKEMENVENAFKRKERIDGNI